jgi:hypothetical protein
LDMVLTRDTIRTFYSVLGTVVRLDMVLTRDTIRTFYSVLGTVLFFALEGRWQDHRCKAFNESMQKLRPTNLVCDRKPPHPPPPI